MDFITKEEISERLANNNLLRLIKPRVGLSAYSREGKDGKVVLKENWYSIAYTFDNLEVPLWNIYLKDGEYGRINAILKEACQNASCFYVDLGVKLGDKVGPMV